MKIKQLSIFLENKAGRINDMVNVLKDADINMMAFSLAESEEFGIMRIIVSDTERAVDTLKANKFTVSITEVICLKIDDSAGAMAAVLDCLTPNGIFIEYMYAFSQCSSAYVVLRPTDVDGCVEVLKKVDCKFISSFEE